MQPIRVQRPIIRSSFLARACVLSTLALATAASSPQGSGSAAVPGALAELDVRPCDGRGPTGGGPSATTLSDLGPYLDGRILRFDALGNLENVADYPHEAARALLHHSRRGIELVPCDADRSGLVVGFARPDGDTIERRQHARQDDGTALFEGPGREIDARTLAFVANTTGMRAIHAPRQRASRAHGVNAHGDVVGFYVDEHGAQRAFVWSNGVLTDLDGIATDATAWRLLDAFDVDDRGNVVGLGRLDGELHLFLLGHDVHPPLGGDVSRAGNSVAIPGGFHFAPAMPDCYDGGFEDGTFGGWACYSGSWSATTYSIAPSNCALGPNTVVTTGSADPLLATLPQVSATGGGFAIRLGDSSPGARVDAIRRSFLATDASFTFQYALVMQAFHSDTSVDPFFRVRVWTDSISTPFYDYKKVASTSDSFFTLVSGITVARLWSCVTVDLSAHLGEIVTIQVEIADCSGGAHFGYAYFDIPCEPPHVALTVPSVACGNEPIIADGTGNVGVVHYSWTVERVDASGTPYAGTQAAESRIGSPTTLDVRAYYADFGYSIVCGNWYRVTLGTQTECAGWMSTSQIVHVGCAPVADAGPDLFFCNPNDGDTVSLNSGTWAANLRYQWFDPNGAPVGVGAFVTIFLPATTTTYTLVVTDPETGCSSSDSMTVGVYYGACP